MPRPTKTQPDQNETLTAGKPVNIKSLAKHLGLSIAAVSRILNHSPAAKSIAAETRERVFATAKELNYRPNIFARSLRSKRSYTIGVMVAEVSEGYATLVLSGIEKKLMEEDYFYFVVSHHHRPELIAEYENLLMARAIEGLVAVDTPLNKRFPVPTVTISGHKEPPGVVNIVLDHKHAACLAIEHLQKLGHRKIAFMRGQTHTSDSETRWTAIQSAAQSLNVELSPRRVIQLEGNDPSPEPGYIATKKLLHSGQSFTALFAFNDISAIGAVRALREARLRIPEDVSIVGFDDIQTAAYLNPGLTTVRQPLVAMGVLAAQSVLRLIQNPDDPLHAARELIVHPELVVRGSTSAPPKVKAAR
jgi:DNA-binding LacI/PurR family transcriptional regulator